MNKYASALVTTLQLLILLEPSVGARAEPPGARGGISYGGFSEEDTGEGHYLSKITDKTYEYGKAIYLGKHKDYPKIEYCIRHQEGVEIVPIKSKTLEKYKKGKYQVLLQNLYACKKPDQPLYKTMDVKVLLAIIYYLNEIV